MLLFCEIACKNRSDGNCCFFLRVAGCLNNFVTRLSMASYNYIMLFKFLSATSRKACWTIFWYSANFNLVIVYMGLAVLCSDVQKVFHI